MSSTNVIWTLLAATLVFMMQAGFAMLETGFTRAKNAGNIAMKNLMDYCIGTVLFWIFGFGIMFGPSIGGIIGKPDFFVTSSYQYNQYVPTMVYLMFQTVFCATSATIVSGAMAERTKFSAYLIYSALISAIVYPISGHWCWNSDGWLAQLGFHDFAGSTVVHMVGGISALVGAIFLGPRIGKFDKNGKARAIPGHSMTLAMLGIFLLWIGWFGFNPGSTITADGKDTWVEMGSIFITTNLAAAVGALTAMFLAWKKYGKPDVGLTINGALAGLIGITAGCDVVSPVGAFFIGLICAFIYVYAASIVENKFKIDDPVGAFAAHGCCGAGGTLLVGLFAKDGGLFYGGGLKLLGVELLGVVAVAAWTTVTMIIIFWVIKHTIGLRVSAKEELSGLDLPEHGLVAAYADFEPSVLTKSEDSYEARVAREAEAEAEAAAAAGATAKEAAAAK